MSAHPAAQISPSFWCLALFGLNLTVDLYERASGGLLSATKTFLQVVGEPDPGTALIVRAVIPAATPMVDLPEFRYLGPMVGRAVDVDAMWARAVDSVRLRLARIPLLDLPLAERCRIVNVYGLSKLFFLDRFVPCPVDRIRELKVLIVRKIWGDGRRPAIRLPRLARSQDTGGFGLLELTAQLGGHRAEHVRRLAFVDPLPPDLLERRAVIEYAASVPSSGFALHDGHRVRKGIPRDPNKPWRGWSWSLVLGLRSVNVKRVAGRQLKSIERAMGPRWSAYLAAWQQETSFEVPLDRALEAVTWASVGVLDLAFGPMRDRMCRPFARVDLLTTAGIDQPRSLNRGSHRLSIRDGPIVASPKVAEPAAWSKLWTALKKARRARPVEVDSLHRLIFRSLHGADHGYVVHDADRPWAASPACSLCGLDSCLDSARGLFDSCSATAAIWDAIGIDGPRPRTDDLVLPPSRGQLSSASLQERAIFVHAVWTARTRRRFGQTAPGPLNVAAIARRARRAIGQVERVDEDVPDSDDEA